MFIGFVHTKLSAIWVSHSVLTDMILNAWKGKIMHLYEGLNSAKRHCGSLFHFTTKNGLKAH